MEVLAGALPLKGTIPALDTGLFFFLNDLRKWPCSLLQTAPDGWKNSVRHNLSLNKCFEKVENKMSGTSRKGCLWALNPAKIDKMEEEMQKWKRKDLAAILRSMANPGEQQAGTWLGGSWGRNGKITGCGCRTPAGEEMRGG